MDIGVIFFNSVFKNKFIEQTNNNVFNNARREDRIPNLHTCFRLKYHHYLLKLYFMISFTTR